MRIPLTKYGLPQVAIIPATLLAVMILYFIAAVNLFPEKIRSAPSYAILAILTVWLPELILLIVIAWVFSFFRDPRRIIPDDPTALLSPADGTITDIQLVSDVPGLEGQYTRVGIFLSIFNVHINRTPCAVRIEKVTYKEGRFINAMDPESGRVNESNDILMTRLIEPCDTLLVRQLTGAIARRIVCDAHYGQEFAGGMKFGMLKFGSRTELYLPYRKDVKCLVQIGDKVKAGLTKLAAYHYNAA